MPEWLKGADCKSVGLAPTLVRIQPPPPASRWLVAGRLQAEVGGLLVVPLVVGHQLDLDVERQGAERAGEAVFLCGEGADVGHDVFSVRLNKVRAHRVLVVIRPAGDGLAAPLAVATQWRAGRRKEFVPRGMRAAQGEIVFAGRLQP